MTNKIKINCIPVVNFYEKSGEPFEYHHSKESYPVVIDHARLNSIVPICVKSMHKTSNQVAIKCEEISEININLVKNKNSYFVSKSYVDDKLSDLCFQLYSDEKEAEQIISYDAWVYNKNTPAEGISPNAKFLIKKKEESFTLINLQRPSKEKKVFNINRSYETCLEILGMHFSDITNVSAFKKMLMLFVPKDDRKVNKMKYVDSIIDIKISYQDYLKKGMMRNIMIVTFIAHLNHFDNIGEAILWFKVLAKVLSAYVPVNQSVKIMTQVEDEEESWVSFCKL
jgi:type VI protein secretion system component VasA